MAQYTEYHPLKFWLDPASIAEIVAHIQTYLVNNPINSTTEIETIIHDYLIAHPELIGGVDSVNGLTGEVVLTADNISGGENVTIKDVLDSLQDQINDIVASIPSDYQQLINDVSDLKSAIEMYDVTKSRLLYYGNYNTKADTVSYPIVSKNTDAKMRTFCIRASSFGEITNNYAVGYRRFRADGTVIQIQGIKQSDILNGFIFTITSATTKIEIYVNSGGVASTIESLEIWESEIDCVVLSSPKTFNVNKDGSGDFTTLVSAINYARFYYGSTLYIGAGEWNIVDELGTYYIESISSTQRGVILDNGIHIIFSPKAIVRCEYTGSTAQTIRWLSAFNSGKYGFTLENAVIYSSNCLYTIHDERGGSTDFYINKYINCQFYHNNPVHFQCIGGGLGLEGYIVISGCYFECTYLTGIDGAAAIVTYHNNASANSKSKINISNCYFAGKTGIRFGYYGASTEKSIMYVNNTSFGRRSTNSIIVEAENADATINNVEALQWLNEFRLDIANPLTGLSSSIENTAEIE